MSLSYKNDCGVFINILGIEDSETLKVAEYLISAYRSIEIENWSAVLPIDFGLEKLQAIHKHLFQDVYGWAGQTRTVQSSKHLDSNTNIVSWFAEPDTIQAGWQALEEKIQDIDQKQNLNFDQKRDELVAIFVEANKLHAFPEGNGRSLQVFMKLLAKKQGVNLDYTKTNPLEWNRACAVSGTHGLRFENVVIPQTPNLEPIKKVFAEMAHLSSTRDTEVGALKHTDLDSRAELFERADRDVAFCTYPDLESACDALDIVMGVAVKGGLKDRRLDVFMKTIAVELGKRLDSVARTLDPQQVSHAAAPLPKIVAPKMKM